MKKLMLNEPIYLGEPTQEEFNELQETYLIVSQVKNEEELELFVNSETFKRQQELEEKFIIHWYYKERENDMATSSSISD